MNGSGVFERLFQIRNQIIRIVDNTTGFTVGSCGLSSFEKLEEIETPEEGADEDGHGDSDYGEN